MKTETTPKKVTVNNEAGVELLAENIIEVSRAAKRLLNSRLTDRAIVLLIQDCCDRRVGLDTIQAVLRSASTLEATYIKKAASN